MFNMDLAEYKNEVRRVREVNMRELMEAANDNHPSFEPYKDSEIMYFPSEHYADVSAIANMIEEYSSDEIAKLIYEIMRSKK